MSVGSIIDNAHIIVFSDLVCWILDKDNHRNIIAIGDCNTSNGLYYFRKALEANAITDSINKNVDLWYRRVGHLSYQGLYYLLQQNRVSGLPHLTLNHATCENYLVGPQHQ